MVITFNMRKTNVSLEKKYTAEEITEAECLKLISEKKKKI